MDKETNPAFEILNAERLAKQQEAKDLFAKAKQLQEQARALQIEAERATADGHTAVLDSFRVTKQMERIVPNAVEGEHSDCIVDEMLHSGNIQSIYYGKPNPLRVCEYHYNHPSVVALREKAEREFGHIVMD